MPKYFARFTLPIVAENEDEALTKAWEYINEGEQGLLFDDLDSDKPAYENYSGDLSRNSPRT